MRTRHLIACGLAALSLLAAGCSEEEASESGSAGKQEESGANELQQDPAAEQPADTGADRAKPKITVPKGKPPKQLVSKDLIQGKGAAATAGQTLSVNYLGVNYSDGKEFDTSFGSGQPFQFQLGAGMVIPGWDQGLEGMKVGGRRQLTIPAQLAYGPQGQPPAIGPNETLVFVIDLLAAQ